MSYVPLFVSTFYRQFYFLLPKHNHFYYTEQIKMPYDPDVIRHAGGMPRRCFP